MSNVSAGKMTLNIVVGVLCGLAFALMIMLQVILPFPCLLIIMGAILYGNAGKVPVIVMTGVALIACVFGWGFEALALIVPMCFLPLIPILLNMRARKPFGAQMRVAVGATLIGTVLSVLMVVVLYGTNAISSVMDSVAALYESYLPNLWAVQKDFYLASGLNMDYSTFASTFMSIIDMIRVYFETYLPANLLTGSILTAVLAVFWGNWRMARHGNSNSESYKQINDWFLPKDLVSGILFMVIALGAIKLIGKSLALSDALAPAILMPVELACTIQFFATMDRSFVRKGRGPAFRRWMHIIMVITCLMSATLVQPNLFTFYAIFGALSALFGSHGLFSINTDNVDNNK